MNNYLNIYIISLNAVFLGMPLKSMGIYIFIYHKMQLSRLSILIIE